MATSLGTPNGLTIQVKNTYGTAIPARRVCSLDESFAPAEISAAAGGDGTFILPISLWVTSTAQQMVGVSVAPIPIGGYGILLVQGYGLVETGGSVTADDVIEVTTGGKVQTFAAGQKVGRAAQTDFTTTDDQDFGAATLTLSLCLIDPMAANTDWLTA